MKTARKDTVTLVLLSLGTRRVQTDYSGVVEQDCMSLPYGDSETCTPPPSGALFTGKERDSESGNDYFGARYYGSTMGRFLSPDPLGGHLEYPQSLNKYAYVMNNPLRYTDPTGMDLWLQGCGKNSSTCQHNYVGTTDKQGHFHRTHLSGDQRKNATLGRHGISVKYGGKTYSGVWDTNKGENNAVDVAGTGALGGFSARVTGNCNGTCVASGQLLSTDLTSPANLSFGVFNALNGAAGWTKNPGWEAMDFFHPGATNFHGYAETDPEGLPSTHVPVVVAPNATVPWHIDQRYPWEDVVGFGQHTGSVFHTLFNDVTGAGGGQ